MTASDTFTAGQLQDGQTCPACQDPVLSGQIVRRCPRCGHVQHSECWAKTGRCHSYDCDAGVTVRGSEAADAGSPLVITADDMARARPAAPAPVIVVPGWKPVEPPVRTRLSILAVTAFIVALLGLFLFGAPGLVAIVLGAVSMGLIHSRRDLRGAGFSAVAIIIGVIGVAGWTAALCLIYVARSDRGEPLNPPGISRPAEVIGIQDLAKVAEPIRRAIRANVLITARSIGQIGMGSGVVLASERGQVFIITNRHVIDGPSGDLNAQSIEVTLADGTRSDAQVKWRADKGVDLALITCPAGNSHFAAADVAREPELAIGEAVFAVGNPLGLGWTYTQGVISALREDDRPGDTPLRIIQMQVPLNPGNSGGGLYDRQGRLIGINSFITDRRSSEGISFALAISSLIPVIEKHGGISLQTEHPERQDRP